MLHKERIKVLKGGSQRKGKYVLYWMEASQRVKCNHALEFAVRQSNAEKLPLVVYFCLDCKQPGLNLRNVSFLLNGLQKTEKSLKAMGANFVFELNSPTPGVVKLSKQASVVIFDRGYMPYQRASRQAVLDKLNVPVIQVESDIVVPVEAASNKEEYAAYTIRPKINRACDYFLQKLQSHTLDCQIRLDIPSTSLANIAELLVKSPIDQTVSCTEKFHPSGSDIAEKRLKEFIDTKLPFYSDLRNDLTKDYQSNLSPYLRFGQISPLEITKKVKASDAKLAADFLEELIVRRELAINFVYYNEHCQTFSALPDWARATLKEHESDLRQNIYTFKELEQGKTSDPYWNAAMQQLLKTGKMHGYMRMYWGKMLLKWHHDPALAFKHALMLNDKYELDGRSPNGCAGVAWCFGKHDRPWPEHQIFGKVRMMSSGGLKRKFDIDSYVDMVNFISTDEGD